MVCGNKLVKPCLMSSQVMDGQSLHQVYGQKIVYLCPEVKLGDERNKRLGSTASFFDEVLFT